MIKKMLEYNKQFVESKAYEAFQTTKYPDKKIAIVTCMDTRLVLLLPAALGIKNGDVKLIKNAGGLISGPFDSSMRSLLVAVYELGVEYIMIIAHTDCGVQGMEASEMLHLMHERGIDEGQIQMVRNCGIDLDKWLTGFEDTHQSVRDSMKIVKNHPLMPSDIKVSGFIMDTVTGALHEVV